MKKLLLAAGTVLLSSFAAGQLLAGELPLANPSFEEDCSTETKIGNWLLVVGPGGIAWSRWDRATGGVVASAGSALLFTNSPGAVVVQLIKEVPIQPGKYVFSADAASPAGGAGVESVSSRGLQMAIYAVPTTIEKEPRHTIIADKSISAEELSQDEEWKTLEVAFEISPSSPFIGQFFQINLTSTWPAPNAPEPAQIDIDNIRAQKLE